MLLSIGALSVLIGGFVPVSAAKASGIVVESVILARSADDPSNPSGRTSIFGGADTVFAVARLEGRPKVGVVTGVFSFRGTEFARTAVDLKDRRTKSELAGDTFITFNVAPTPGTRFLIGSYKLRILLDDKVDGSVEFSVVPRRGAFATRITRSRTVADDGTVRKVFARNETVTVELGGDFALDSWLEVEWSVGGKIDPDGTQSATVTKAAKNGALVFSHKPTQGWPIGKHSIAFVMDDRPAGVVSFTVR